MTSKIITEQALQTIYSHIIKLWSSLIWDPLFHPVIMFLTHHQFLGCLQELFHKAVGTLSGKAALPFHFYTLFHVRVY